MMLPGGRRRPQAGKEIDGAERVSEFPSPAMAKPSPAGNDTLGLVGGPPVIPGRTCGTNPEPIPRRPKTE